MPSRRTFLRSIGAESVGALAGLAGCSATARPLTATPPGERNDQSVQRQVTLASQDTVPDGHAVGIDVEVVESTVTDEHPARLRVTTTNQGARRAISVGPGQCGLFNRNAGASDDPAGLWLHRPEESRWIERDGTRWSRDAPPSRERVYAAYACLSPVYDTGESVTNEWSVWDDYQVVGYMEPGVYRFEESVTISPVDDSGHAGDPGARFDWGFSLRVERP